MNDGRVTATHEDGTVDIKFHNGKVETRVDPSRVAVLSTSTSMERSVSYGENLVTRCVRKQPVPLESRITEDKLMRLMGDAIWEVCVCVYFGFALEEFLC